MNDIRSIKLEKTNAHAKVKNISSKKKKKERITFPARMRIKTPSVLKKQSVSLQISAVVRGDG